MKILNWNVNGYKNQNWPKKNITEYIMKDFFESKGGDIAILHEVPYKNKSNLLQDVFPADYKIEEPKILENSPSCPKFITLATLKNSDISYKIQKGDEWARWLEMEITLGNEETMNVLGVHVPNAVTRIEDKADFWIDILLYAEKHKNEKTIVIGDFNTFTKVDSQKNENSVLSKCLKRLADIGYTDAWRKKHPNKKEYTWHCSENDGRRLDDAFISTSLLPNLKSGDVFYDHTVRTNQLSDHSALILEL